ncbi:MAG: hypothetical protein JWN46_3847 [Acidimicrobiales bacterium]|nr:hypothetical protein [Acidimicrobiales bacterium]
MNIAHPPRRPAARATSLVSALYEGELGHRRLTPVVHAFRTRVIMAYLDLAELPGALDAHTGWSARHWAPVRFRRADYHGDPGQPLDRAVRDTIAARTGVRPTGPIRMLAQLRAFGWAFNPIAFYFAFDPTGRRPETLLAEVTNTPWHERHAYVLRLDWSDPVGGTDDAEGLATATVRFPKALHVSPFMDLDLDHRLVLSLPGGDDLRIRMDDLRGDELLFEADLRLHRRPLDRRTMGHVMRHHLLWGHRVSAGIYWQALRLRLKGAPFRRHPATYPSPTAVAASSGCPAAHRSTS